MDGLIEEMKPQLDATFFNAVLEEEKSSTDSLTRFSNLICCFCCNRCEKYYSCKKRMSRENELSMCADFVAAPTKRKKNYKNGCYYCNKDVKMDERGKINRTAFCSKYKKSLDFDAYSNPKSFLNDYESFSNLMNEMALSMYSKEEISTVFHLRIERIREKLGLKRKLHALQNFFLKNFGKNLAEI